MEDNKPLWLQQLLALKGEDRRRKDSSGVTWRDLAARIGVSAQAVYSWLGGTRTPSRPAQLRIAALHRALLRKQQPVKNDKQ